MFWLEQCAARSDVGNKAKTLGILRAAGLPVLPGLVLERHEVAAGPENWRAEFATRREPDLTGRLIARSSASVEDGQLHTAAGLFHSVAGIRDQAELEQAVAQIAASVNAPAVLAYQRATGGSGPIEMAVIVQSELVEGEIGVALLRATGELVFEQRPLGTPEWGASTAGQLTAGEGSELGRLVGQVAGLITFDQALTVEYAVDANGVYTILQARPVGEQLSKETIDVSSLAGTWSLDSSHNPAPLSPAQASLVELVNRRLGYEACRVVDGYLYAQSIKQGASAVPLAQVASHYRDEVAPRLEKQLQLAAEATAELASATTIFSEVYAELGQLVAPAVAMIRKQLEQFLRVNLDEGLGQHAAIFGDLAEATVRRDQLLWQLGNAAEDARETELRNYLAEFGDYAPGWDVMETTDREHHERVFEQAAYVAAADNSPAAYHERAVANADAAAQQLFERLGSTARGTWQALYDLAREVLTLGELDDRLYFSAQALVRRALVERGKKLVEQGVLTAADDIFFLPTEQILSPEPSANWATAAEAARALWQRQKLRHAPARVVNGRAAPELQAGPVLCGRPSFGSVTGRVLRWREGVPVPSGSSTVLLVAAILPSQTYLLAQVQGLITTGGGALSHGALLAREYNVPGVYGVTGTDALEDGDEVFLDGHTGRVVLLC